MKEIFKKHFNRSFAYGAIVSIVFMVIVSVAVLSVVQTTMPVTHEFGLVSAITANTITIDHETLNINSVDISTVYVGDIVIFGGKWGRLTDIEYYGRGISGK